MLTPGLPPISFSTNSQSIKKLDTNGISPSFGLCYTAWEAELRGDIDREFILDGIKNGFDIIDKDAEPEPV